MRLSGQPCASDLVDQRIELALLAHHAADDIAKERRLRRQILLALDLAADPMTLELGQDVVEAGAGDIHLIERLHRREPRRAAPVGLAHLRSGLGARPIRLSPLARRRLSRTSASAARGGITALVRLRPSCARIHGLRVGVDGQDAIADRHAAGARVSISARADFERHDLEMDGVAANDTAERHHAVVGLAAALGGIQRHRDRRWNSRATPAR